MIKGDILEIKLTDLNNLGCGVGHAPDGRAVFVNGAVAGDTVKVSIIKVNKSFAVGRVIEVTEKSPDREDGYCDVPATCGGCVYRYLTYEKELLLKRGFVEYAFKKAGLSDIVIEDVRTTGVTKGYRNKAEYPITNGKNGLYGGFYAQKTHRVVAADGCSLQPEIFGEILRFFCEFYIKEGASAYDEETATGLIRHLYLREGVGTGEIMVCPVINGKSLPNEANFVKELTARFPRVSSVMVNENTKRTNVVLGDKYRTLFGNSYIEDILCGKRFRIAPASFYQVNHDAAELLYGLAAERTGLSGDGLFIDLYCGAGTIGLSMSERAGEVIGIEIVEAAVECANVNKTLNVVKNASFYCGDATDAEGLLAPVERERGKLSPDVVILDPPRKGCDEQLLRFLAEREVPRIVYVSCGPDTLARDCAVLRNLGYEIGTVTPVDLFPRTGHVESVVCLNKKKTVHEMKLNPSPFEMIKSGKKTIELRLFDEKRQKIKVGDRIVFTDTNTGEKLNTTVVKLHRFNSFEELYKSLPLLQCGYTEENIDKAKPFDMEQYYSIEKQKKYGVVGIELFLSEQITYE